ncbi:hypothetical protein [Embleya sp. NBC_00896]|uniref:hypothetical protein n=1 Tax=Embleya sp. NBC_00896 TaxID=2975961 RepID=UPI002F9081B1|nr:hypothetical protein OG928_45220 [Embleya sp. NBC_00896]
MEFKRARLFDGVDPESGPYFDESRPRIDDQDERERLVEFLAHGGTAVERAAGLAPDRLDASKGKVVPILTMTDGVWIWASAQAYYLEQYGYGPDSEFYEYIKSRGYRADKVGKEITVAALEFLRHSRNVRS